MRQALRPAPPGVSSLAAALLASLALAGLAGASLPNAKQAAGAARKAIETCYSRYLESAKREDPKGLASLYAVDGTLLQTSGKIIRGRADIQQYMENRFHELGVLMDGSIRVRDVFVLGGMVYETGTDTLTFGRDGQAGPTLAGQHVRVWKRARDGTWRIFRDLEVPKD
jgi:uncharacterized protein (TIGR02246 family)